jgi:pilus assembly protein CpaE
MARIFVVDDDEQLLRMVGLMLERGGHTPTLISNPIQGLERIKTDLPDLVILDVMMPGMSGHDLCRQLRLHEPTQQLPVLILTARAQSDREVALESGADEFLSKPVTAQELLRHVNELLNRPPRPSPSEQSDENALPPMLIAVFGLVGGVGRTTLAVNLALALRQISRAPVCLLDLSVSGGQAAMHLRLSPRQGWAELKRQERLDWPTVAGVMTEHHTGLQLLSAPNMPLTPSEPDGETLRRLLTLLQGQMQFTVVDLPPVFNEGMKVTLGMADMGLHLLSPDITAVQTAVRTDRLLSTLSLTPLQRSHILNQRTSEQGLPKQTIERGLNARIPFHLPYDAQQNHALTQGSPLALRGNQPGYSSVVWRMGEALWQKVQASV